MTIAEQIQQLALAGIGLKAVEATVGHPLTGEELVLFRKAQTRYQLLEAKRKRDKAEKSGSHKEIVQRARMAHADIAHELSSATESVNTRRRNRCEKSLVTFATTYCTGEGGFLEVAPPKSMQGILEEMQTAIGDSSMPYHIRIARGHGKTSFMKCAVAWVLSYGIRKYVVSVSADARKASAIIGDVLAFMTSSPAWCEDFPEISVPLKRLGGAFQRAKSQTCRGKNTNIRLSAAEMRLPTMVDEDDVPYPASGAILTAVGLTGNARGLVHGSMRPDLVLFDDLQNDAMAKSDERVMEAAQTIRKSFMGLAGHRRKIAAIMTSTPIEPDDLSETFAADKSWKTTTYKMVMEWPKCYKKDGDLWREYADIYQREVAEGRKPHLAANKFYMEHRKAMDAGAKVLNADNYDRRTEKSAIQHAMNILIRDGESAFMSEYQMQPPRNSFAFALTAKLILSRVRPGIAANTIPDGSVLTVAATDINPAYALTTTVIAFDIQMTAFVAAYHVTPIKISDKINDTEYDSRIYAALSAHGREIAALGIRLDAWGIDAGGKQFNAVTRFAPVAETMAGVNLHAVAMLGRAGQNWNPNVRSRIRSERNGTILCADPQKRRWVAWNADEHKERAHRAWATETGAPGGLSLFDGGANHYRFAAQVANEKLCAKTRIKSRDGREAYAYKWLTREPHDYGDCVAMCYALAAHSDLSPDGALAPAVDNTQGFEIL